jgi:class 3 adenylate cyclase
VALVAVVVTDLVASTESRIRLGDQVVDQLRRGHDDALRAVTGRRGGQVVKGLGDGLLVTFSGTSEAVTAAVALQQAIDRLNRRAAEPLAMRVGISAGEVTWEDGDCFGVPVIEASRLCAAAEGDQILCSDLVRALGRGPGGPSLTAVGRPPAQGAARAGDGVGGRLVTGRQRASRPGAAAHAGAVRLRRS